MDAELARVDYGELCISRLIRTLAEQAVPETVHGVALRENGNECFCTLPEAQALAVVLELQIPNNGTDKRVRLLSRIEPPRHVMAMGDTLWLGEVRIKYADRMDVAAVVRGMATMKFDQFGPMKAKLW